MGSDTLREKKNAIADCAISTVKNILESARRPIPNRSLLQKRIFRGKRLHRKARKAKLQAAADAAAALIQIMITAYLGAAQMMALASAPVPNYSKGASGGFNLQQAVLGSEDLEIISHKTNTP